MTDSRPSERVWRAQAIVAEQAGCALYEALARMKARAEVDGCTLEDIAAAVVAGELTFG
jgi:AmiR/NasT family two-component response regulator